MFWRSNGEAPSMRLTQMCRPSPCGYCGATSEITHRGKTKTPSIITAATSMAIVEVFDIIASGFM
jgi:hypothetical protein